MLILSYRQLLFGRTSRYQSPTLRNLENSKYDMFCERRCPVLALTVSHTLHLPLLSIFRHPLLISPWPECNYDNSSSSRSDGPSPSSVVDNMPHDYLYCMWITTSTHSNSESLDKDGNDGSSLTYEAKVSVLFQLYGTGFK